MTTIKRKPVAFNVDDPYQLELLNYTKKYPNFSGYIKRLIQRDYEGGNSISQVNTQPFQQPHVDVQPVKQEIKKVADPVNNQTDKDLFKGLI